MRFLSPTETLFMQSNMAMICVLDLDGGVVDEDVLQEAFDTLAEENPVLASHIERRDDGFVVRPRPDGVPTLRLQHSTTDAAVVEANTPLEPDESLARLTLYRRGDQSTIALAIHHCFGDGRFIIALSERLLDFYAVIASGMLAIGAELAITPSDEFGPSLDSLVAQDSEPVVMPPFGRVVTLPRNDLSAETPGGINVLSIQFDEDATTAMLDLARLRGLSPFGLISGAAAAAILDDHSTDAGDDTVAVWALIDLRSRMDPPVPVTANTFCSGMAFLPLRTNGSADHITLGRQAMAELRSSLKQRVPQRMVATLAEAGPAAIPPTSFTISSVGRMAEPVLPGGLRLIAHRGIVPPGPQSAAPGVIIVNTGGRLGIDITYSRAMLADEHVGRWANQLSSYLTGGKSWCPDPVRARRF